MNDEGRVVSGGIEISDTGIAREVNVAGEEAPWTAGTSIGRILAQFTQSGIESG